MKNPWMPMFFGDFLANTLHLSTAEIGAYVLLIAHAWEHNAEVPWDNARRIARMDTRSWKRVEEKLLPFFQCSAPEAARRVRCSERVRLELARAAEISSKRKDAALQMHSKRRASADANASGLHMHPPSQSLKRSYAREGKQANGTYRPSGMSPEVEDYRSPPRTKSDNVLEPIPDRPQPKPNPKLEALKQKSRSKGKKDDQHEAKAV